MSPPPATRHTRLAMPCRRTRDCLVPDAFSKMGSPGGRDEQRGESVLMSRSARLSQSHPHQPTSRAHELVVGDDAAVRERGEPGAPATSRKPPTSLDAPFILSLSPCVWIVMLCQTW